ncbi:MAG: Holliday junction resolvase RuvX [Patescibacteria group bacterium]
MKYLGIDYGRKKIGLAISGGKLAEPLQVVRYKDYSKMIDHIKRIIEKQKIEKVVVGISEGEMAEEIKRFVETIRYTLYPVPCEVSDETLSSHDAQQMSIASHMGRKKRKEMEDAFAASIMLQNYIDSTNII